MKNRQDRPWEEPSSQDGPPEEQSSLAERVTDLETSTQGLADQVACIHLFIEYNVDYHMQILRVLHPEIAFFSFDPPPPPVSQ